MCVILFCFGMYFFFVSFNEQVAPDNCIGHVFFYNMSNTIIRCNLFIKTHEEEIRDKTKQNKNTHMNQLFWFSTRGTRLPVLQDLQSTTYSWQPWMKLTTNQIKWMELSWLHWICTTWMEDYIIVHVWLDHSNNTHVETFKCHSPWHPIVQKSQRKTCSCWRRMKSPTKSYKLYAIAITGANMHKVKS